MAMGSRRSSGSWQWQSLLVVFLLSSTARGQLTPSFYATSCPLLELTVRTIMVTTLLAEPRMGASLLRLHFHDCFVQGCDGSILLDDNPSTNFIGEKHAVPNNDSVRGYEVIDLMKSAVELICPGVVSCADIVALAARDGTFLLGGPSWAVPLGRRDSTRAYLDDTNDLPGPTLNLDALIAAFGKKNLSPRDLTALSGAHTIGQAQCLNFRDHIYNDTNIDPAFAALRRRTCPLTAGAPGEKTLAPLDLRTPVTFDNSYYGNLVAKRGLMHSDQELFNGGSQDALVHQYCSNPALFASDFVTAMIKMGNISPLTGTNGQIRRNCRVINSS